MPLMIHSRDSVLHNNKTHIIAVNIKVQPASHLAHKIDFPGKLTLAPHPCTIIDEYFSRLHQPV